MQSLIATLKREGDVVWSRFNSPKDLKINYYRLVLEQAKEVLPVELL